tara:strand:- start:8932 stop:10059 length:1128 start_codon:yes stop_codon:yes gene_type:complete
MRKVPIAVPYLGKEEAEAASEVILSGWVTQGTKVAEFEKVFADYVGSNYAVALSSCTTALHLSMIVAGVNEGDEVICPSMSYIATTNCIKYVGAKPVFAEVNEHYNLDVKDVESKISSKTKAVLIVHQIGMPADIDAFKELCERKGLILIEDAACAIGSEYKGRKIGSHSDLVCFSFHPRKILTTGDGGMIATSKEHFYNRLKTLRQHSMSINDRVRHESKKVIIEEYPEIGYNYRMTDIQAAIGIEQLKKLDLIVSERRKVAQRYINAFQYIDSIILPIEVGDIKTNYQSFSILLKENALVSRNDLMQKLLDNGVSTRRGIMTSHREKAYSGEYDYNLPLTEKISDNSLLLPLYFPMAEKDVDHVIKMVKKFLI